MKILFFEEKLWTCYICHIVDIQWNVNYMSKIHATNINDKVHEELIKSISLIKRKLLIFFIAYRWSHLKKNISFLSHIKNFELFTKILLINQNSN